MAEILKKEKVLEQFMRLGITTLGKAVAKEELKKGVEKKIKPFGEEKESKGVRLVGK